MRDELFPYEVLSNDLNLTIKLATFNRYENTKLIEEPVSERSINHEKHEIFLWAEEYGGWDFLSLLVEVTIPEVEIHKIKNQIDVIAAVNCNKTNLRQTFILRKNKTYYKWSGTINLDKINYFGSVDLKCLLTGQALGRESRFFAESTPWKIYFDEAHSPPIKGAIPIKWINFKITNEIPELRKYAYETHYLAIEDTIPTLYLNSGFEGLPELFSEDNRPKGFHLALSETTSSSIAKSVWMAMFQTALSGIRRYEDEDEFDWPDITWQKNILQQLLPHIYSDLKNEAALQKAGSDVSSGAVNRLESEALAVINKVIINEGKTIRKAIYQIQKDLIGESND